MRACESRVVALAGDSISSDHLQVAFLRRHVVLVQVLRQREVHQRDLQVLPPAGRGLGQREQATRLGDGLRVFPACRSACGTPRAGGGGRRGGIGWRQPARSPARRVVCARRGRGVQIAPRARRIPATSGCAGLGLGMFSGAGADRRGTPARSSSSHTVAGESDGGASRRAATTIPEPTLGPFGIAERLNWLPRKKRTTNTSSQCFSVAVVVTALRPRAPSPATRHVAGRPRPRARGTRPCARAIAEAAQVVQVEVLQFVRADHRFRRMHRLLAGRRHQPGEIRRLDDAGQHRASSSVELPRRDQPAHQVLDKRLRHRRVHVVVRHGSPTP